VVSLDVYGLSAGTYTVDVNGVSAPFILQVDNFPVEEKASVQGRLWHDLCAVAGGEGGTPAIPTVGCVRGTDGAYRANGVLETNEPGLGGVLINLGLGVCPASGLASITTNADGSYAFSDLAPGTYCVSIDPLQGANTGLLIPGGWTSPAEAVDDAVASYTLTLGAGEDRKDLNFGWDYQFLPQPPALPTPTPTQAPVTPTPRPGLCDAASFVADVTIPDGTTLAPKTDFTKTWRLRNVGTCTWTTDYDLVFVSGDQMGAPASVPVTKFVKPGETLEISVRMSAPAKLGRYSGSWQLRNANGKIFGIGEQADGSFWVRVRVHEPTVAYDLIKVMCKAVWRDGNGQLACPGSETTESGYVFRVDNLQLENGQTENEPALVVHPHGLDHGLIVGRFPAFKIQPGDRFKAVIGCVGGAETCDVTFRLRYSIPGVDGGTLDTWSETYDGKIRKLDVDLSQLAGHEVEIMLTVRDNGSSDGDLAFWLGPRIVR
jgi:hypothetical protein